MTDNPLYEDWKHCIGLVNPKGMVLTGEMLKNWVETDGRLECAFCSILYDNKTKTCRICKDYKGFRPYIAEWSNDE